MCLPNGTWFSSPLANGSNSGWTNYSSCFDKSSLFGNSNHDIDLGVANIVLVGIFLTLYYVAYVREKLGNLRTTFVLFS